METPNEEKREDAAAVSQAAPDSAVATPEPAGSGPAEGGVDVHKLEQLVIDALHTVYDPEIPVDIYELGLIYSIDIDPQGKVAITMTLTTPACPVAGSMPGQVENYGRHRGSRVGAYLGSRDDDGVGQAPAQHVLKLF
jgi:hypothetical protein